VKKLLLATTALTAFVAVGSASAADMPVKAPPSPPVPASTWTGFYVGANAGWTWGRSDANTSANCNVAFVAAPALPYFCDNAGFGAANGAAVNAAGTGTVTSSGFTGGIEAGYNWQLSSLIYGLETDFGAFHLKGSNQGGGPYPTPTVIAVGAFQENYSIETNWLYTFRGRLGVPVAPSLMAYATGGLAVTRLEVRNSFSDNVGTGASGNATGDATKAGYVVGGGLEWAITNNWSVKAEYLYLNFGKATATGTITNNVPGIAYAQGISTSSDLTAQVARVGVNRKF
jgi:outer membrane immunogenic protein